MEEFDLIDIARELHPKKIMYTYESKALKSKSRIDFLLISKKLKPYVRKSFPRTSVRIDHKAILLSMSVFKPNDWGPGFWKFNNTLIEDQDYLNLFKKEYDDINHKYQDLSNKRLLWDVIKMEIRGFTRKYCKQKKTQL